MKASLAFGWTGFPDQGWKTPWTRMNPHQTMNNTYPNKWKPCYGSVHVLGQHQLEHFDWTALSVKSASQYSFIEFLSQVFFLQNPLKYVVLLQNCTFEESEDWNVERAASGHSWFHVFFVELHFEVGFHESAVIVLVWKSVNMWWLHMQMLLSLKTVYSSDVWV